VERDLDQVERPRLLGQAIAHALLLGRPRAEQGVPDDEDPAVVLVEVLMVGPVVDAMVRRRVEHALDPAWQPVDPLGVDPELVDHRDPRLAQRGREVVVLRGVVDDVAGPEHAALVGHAVEPVVREVVSEEERDPRQRVAGVEAQRRQLVQRRVHRDDDDLPPDVDDHVDEAHRERGARVAGREADEVVLVVVEVPERRLLRDEQHHEERIA
jgi:hypothetical protein